MWVVKLGGSLGRSPRLTDWLRTLKSSGVAIVPGGGEFADTVRRTQARLGFSDEAAHAMAILAMAQYGLMLKGLEPVLETTRNPAALRTILEEGKSAIWLPHPDDIAVKPGWAVTSDSLAVWLAGRIGARDLVLIKSAPLPPVEASVGAAQASGLVDQAFGCFLRAGTTRAWLCHCDRHQEFAAALRTPADLFTRIAA
ncbi:MULTISPECIES: amino acid kinase family protein [Methylococcus]|uniref:amino acid kinase family protein n=1 Tax=Methylococcus TaxID=413 RepID=UPI001C532E4D|nr:amino acid kinase [Methylococcus capsulatus]QXP93664.1 amino acid kinase [Methylococcus capsulatus]